MNNHGFAPMDDEEYNETFVSALVDAYMSRGDDLLPVEQAVLDLIATPGEVNYTPLVYHGHTLMATVGESHAVTLAGFIDDIYHGRPDPSVPVILPIEEWRGNNGTSITAALNWFRHHIAAACAEGPTATTIYRLFTVNCEVAAVIAASPTPIAEGLIESMSSASHSQLHTKKNAFVNNDSEDDLASLFEEISNLLSNEGGQ